MADSDAQQFLRDFDKKLLIAADRLRDPKHRNFIAQTGYKSAETYEDAKGKKRSVGAFDTTFTIDQPQPENIAA